MILKILKILTVVSFLAIKVEGEVIGGPLGAFLVLGLLADFLTMISSLIILTILLLFLYSAIKPFKPIDLFTFIAGGVVLIIPIIIHANSVMSEMTFSSGRLFYITLLPFILFYSLTLSMMIRQNQKRIS